MARYIDADAIPYETHYVPDGDTEWAYKEEQCVCKSSIDQMPTIEARPVVRGEWIMKETMIRSPYAKNAYCSVCLEETGYAHNFCPNCGADMRGDDDG